MNRTEVAMILIFVCLALIMIGIGMSLDRDLWEVRNQIYNTQLFLVSMRETQIEREFIRLENPKAQVIDIEGNITSVECEAVYRIKDDTIIILKDFPK